MKIRIIPRLRRDLVDERYREDPKERSRRVSEGLERMPLQELIHIGLRRANRTHPLPPYEPFAVVISPAAAAKIDQFPETVSVSAIVQELLKPSPKENH